MHSAGMVNMVWLCPIQSRPYASREAENTFRDSDSMGSLLSMTGLDPQVPRLPLGVLTSTSFRWVRRHSEISSFVRITSTTARLPRRGLALSGDLKIYGKKKMKSLAFVCGCLVSVTALACDINFNVELQSFGESVTVELRSGSPGGSRPVASRKSQGGQVSFGKLCAGSYFLAIGNDDYVSVTPVKQFQDDHDYSSRITLQRGSGNVSKKSRKSL